MMKGHFYVDISVEFEDVKFLRATSISKDTDVEFNIVIHPGSGRFEISEGTSSIVTGFIKAMEKPKRKDLEVTNEVPKDKMETKDFYKELRLRGYHYNDQFRSVVESSFDGKYGKVKWDGNWIAFMDCLLQLKIIGKDTRNLVLPTGIEKIKINVQKHLEFLTKFSDDEQQIYEAFIDDELKLIRCGGIEMLNMRASIVGRRKAPGIPVLEVNKFIPYDSPSTVLSQNDACRVLSQLFIENSQLTKIKVVEIDGNDGKKPILNDIREALSDLPLITSNLTYLSTKTSELNEDIPVVNESIENHNNCGIIIISIMVKEVNYMNQLVDGGFLVIRCSKPESPYGFRKIAAFRVANEVYAVFQKKTENNQDLLAFVISQHDSSFKWVEEVKLLMKKGPLVLVSQQEPTSGLLGLVNCLRKEPGGKTIRSVFIDDTKAPKFDLKHQLYNNQLKLGLAVNVYRRRCWGSFKHVKINPIYMEKPMTSHCYCNSLVKSDLSSLKWLQGPLDTSHDNTVKVHYASLNFKDVMLATGKISVEMFVDHRLKQECVLGIEYSGVTSSNEKIMGMNEAGSLATHVTRDALLSWKIPDHWTLEQAASVPCVYGTVYYAFFMVTQIQKGKSILIHAGTGGIGLAAIRVAFAYGLDVFTTVSTEEKKNFLLKEFPQLKNKNIGNSRDTSFEDMIMKNTFGKGVDYVLNSLAEEKLLASIRCLGRRGKFLEIGKFDMEKGTKIGMEVFLKEIAIHSVMLDQIFNRPDAEKMVS